MKRNLVLIFLSLLATLAQAMENEFGIGLILGEPTGISIKKWLDHNHAIDAAAAWSTSENHNFQLHADYLMHQYHVFRTDRHSGQLPVYYGVGGRVRLENEDNGKGHRSNDLLISFRMPLGISYLFAHVPIDIFVEVVPMLDIVPDTDFDINAAFGVRFYLK
jgi:hypothetical protein